MAVLLYFGLFNVICAIDVLHYFSTSQLCSLFCALRICFALYWDHDHRRWNVLHAILYFYFFLQHERSILQFFSLVIHFLFFGIINLILVWKKAHCKQCYCTIGWAYHNILHPLQQKNEFEPISVRMVKNTCNKTIKLTHLVIDK